MVNQSLKIKTARTRRPAFDREQGIETARELFHARGYDAVGIAELTQALDIVPPSLYAAYGSKLALFERALQSYIAKQMLPLDKILSSDAPPRQGAYRPVHCRSQTLHARPGVARVHGDRGNAGGRPASSGVGCHAGQTD